MFSIPNKTAYDNQMVLATVKDKNFLYEGRSEWIDVKGVAEDRQYVPAQGKKGLELVQTFMEENDGKLPDLYVISPFKKVAAELKPLLRKGLKGVDVPKLEFHKWIEDSIGTVHTFQGKEAQIVLFCLGGDAGQKGAAKWATS